MYDKKIDLNTSEEYSKMLKITEDAIRYYENCRDRIYSTLKEKYKLKPPCLNGILRFPKEQIEEFKEKEIRQFLSYYMEPTDVHELEEWDIATLRGILEYIKTSSILLFSIQYQVDDIKNEIESLTFEYMKIVNSKDSYENRVKRISDYENRINEIEDEKDKEDAKKRLDILKKAFNYSFILERFDKYGNKEVDTIVNGFFNTKDGTYILNKSKNKFKQFGFDKKLYTRLFNLEETFLEEEYWDYNNLFLYIYLRQMAHSDPYNKKQRMYMESMTSALTNLVYHNTVYGESEKIILDTIRNVLNRFSDYKEKFTRDNECSPNNKIRKEVLKKKADEKKERLIQYMKDIGLDTSTYEENDSIDVNELDNIYKEELKKLVQSRMSDENEEDIDIVIEDSYISDLMKSINTRVENSKYVLEELKEDIEYEKEQEVEEEELSSEEIEESPENEQETEGYKEETEYKVEQQEKIKKVVRMDISTLGFEVDFDRVNKNKSKLDSSVAMDSMFENNMSQLNTSTPSLIASDPNDPSSYPGSKYYAEYKKGLQEAKDQFEDNAHINSKLYSEYVMKMKKAGYKNRYDAIS